MTCWCSSIVAAALFPGLGCEFKYSLIVLVVTRLFPFLFVFVKNFSPYFCFSSILLTYLYCDLEIELNMIESCTAIPFR